MPRRIFLAFSLLSCIYAATLSGQESIFSAVHTLNDFAEFQSVAIDFNNEVIAVGSTSKDASTSDLYYVRMSTDLDLIYQIQLGGSSFEFAHDVLINKHNEVVIIGRTASQDGDISEPNGSIDGWLVVFSDTDELLLSKNLGTTGPEWFESIISTEDGGYLLSGSTKSAEAENYHGDWDFYVMKLDSNYNEEWSRAYGGSSWDMAKDAVELSNGHYVIAGETKSTDGDIENWFGFYDSWAIQLDQEGKIVWSKSFGTERSDFFKNIYFTGDKILISGKTDGGPIYQDNAYLVILEKNGDKVEENIWGGTEGEIIQSVDYDGENLYLGIYSRSGNGDFSCNIGNADFTLAVVDSFSEIQSSDCYGGSNFDVPMDIQLSADKQFMFMVGSSSSSDFDLEGNTGLKAWIIKLDLKEETNIIFEDQTKPKIYPNPTTDLINFEGNSNNTTYKILSSDGKLVQSGKIREKQIRIDELPSGIYILKAQGYNSRIIKL